MKRGILLGFMVSVLCAGIGIAQTITDLGTHEEGKTGLKTLVSVVNANFDSVYDAMGDQSRAVIFRNTITLVSTNGATTNVVATVDGQLAGAYLVAGSVGTGALAKVDYGPFTMAASGDVTMDADSIDSANYVDRSIDAEHIAAGVVGTGALAKVDYGPFTMAASGEVTMDADSIDSANYTDGSIDPEHIAAESLTTNQMVAAIRTSLGKADTALQPGTITVTGVTNGLDTAEVTIDNTLGAATVMVGWISKTAGGAASTNGLLSVAAGANTTLYSDAASPTVVFLSHTTGTGILTLTVDNATTNYLNVVQRDGAIKSSAAMVYIGP